MRQQWLAASWRSAGLCPAARTELLGPFPGGYHRALMCCPRSVAFFILLRMWNEGDVPRGAFEIEAPLPRRKASFLPLAIDFLITGGGIGIRRLPSHTIHD